jgi:cell division protein FtsQ
VTTARAGTERRWKLVRARREAVPSSVRRLHHRGRRPSLRSWRSWLLVVLALVVLGGLGWLVYGTQVLGLRQIEVTGSVLVPAEQVQAVAAVPPGTPLARVDTSAVAARVRSLPSVASVDISRSWPHTLVIEVTERTPLAVAPSPAGFSVLDADGVVFNVVPERPSGVVLFRLTAPGPTDPATRSALAVYAALTPSLRSALVELVAESPDHIHLVLAEDRTVVWGDASRSDVKATVATALLATDAGTIDVSVPDVATTR